MAKRGKSTSPESQSFQQLWDALGSKLMEAAQSGLIPKQRVVGSNPITRSRSPSRVSA